ncbi:hypothetical protein [Bradyrhizobium sp. 5.13L]
MSMLLPVELGIGTGVGEGVGVGVGVGVGLCARTGVAADSATMSATAIATAAATRRTRFSPIVCRVPGGCAVQRMTRNPEAKGDAQKQHELAAQVAIWAELPRSVNRLERRGTGDCSIVVPLQQVAN